MIVGCYSLDLYCRYHETSSGPDSGKRTHPYNIFPAQFNGRTFTECKAQAKKRGWTFEDDYEVTCPICVKQDKQKPACR